MRILLIGYEHEGIALAKLGNQLEKNGHQTKLAQADYYTFIDNTSIRKYFDQIDYEDYYLFEDEYENLYDDEIEVDWEYLKRFENDYSVTKNVQQLLMTDQVVARHHHFRRPYYAPKNPSKNLVYFWIEQMLRWTEEIITDFDPDLIFAPSRTYFVKNAAAQIATATNREMLTLVRSRVGKYSHLVDNFGLGTDDRVTKFVNENNHETYSEAYKEAEQIIKEFRSSGDNIGLYDAIAQQRVQSDQLYEAQEVVKNYLSNCIGLISKSIRRSKKKYRGALRANIFNSYFPYVFKFKTRIALGRLRYIYSNDFTSDIPQDPFIYVPLHTLPESSTLTLSTEYYEDDLIRHIAKEVPADFELAVKENPNMIGIRPYEYYDELREIPNVTLVDPAVPSKRLINRSRGVVGVSGTALLEAAILNKPTHCFGMPEFQAVVDYHGHSELGEFINACESRQNAANLNRIIRYIQYIIKNGKKMPVDNVRLPPSDDNIGDLSMFYYEMLENRIEEI